MCEMHLRQPGFMYSACKSFTKNKKPIQNFKETVNSRHIYQNELDRACFKDGMAYRNFKDFPRRIAAGEVLHIKHLIFLKILYMMDIKAELLQWFISFLIKTLSGTLSTRATQNKFVISGVKSEIGQELARIT